MTPAIFCDLGTLVLAWLAGLTITYGLVESTLFMPVRVAVLAEAAPGATSEMLESLAYCPFCMGFWAHGVASLVLWGDLLAAIRGAFVGVGVMLVARALGLVLVAPPKALELPVIQALRDARGDEP